MDEEHVEVTIPSRPAFTREQKFGYAVVIACGVLAVSLGVFYMSKHVKAPFIVSYTGSRFMTGEEAKAAEVAKQKKLDTDGDAINDYDELNIYGSSPYLRDTDSDGISDDIEIASNGDPACAKGAACDSDEDEIAYEFSLDGILPGAVEPDIAEATAQLEQIRTMLQSQTPEDIRLLLVDAGADPAAIAEMSDEEITALYGTVLADLESDGTLAGILEQVQAAGATDAGAAGAAETTDAAVEQAAEDTEQTTP